MNEEFPLWAIPAEQQQSLLTTAWVLCGVSFLFALYLARKERDPYPVWVGFNNAQSLFSAAVPIHRDQRALRNQVARA
jgi:hypothetical protein